MSERLKGVVQLLLIIYSPPCHPRYPCHSFFSRKEIKVFDENIQGVSVQKGETVQRALNDVR